MMHHIITGARNKEEPKRKAASKARAYDTTEDFTLLQIVLYGLDNRLLIIMRDIVHIISRMPGLVLFYFFILVGVLLPHSALRVVVFANPCFVFSISFTRITSTLSDFALTIGCRCSTSWTAVGSNPSDCR